jgi:cytochrome c-type biogenesis protein CcmH
MDSGAVARACHPNSGEIGADFNFRRIRVLGAQANAPAGRIGRKTMLVWTLVIAVAVIACGALFYAGRAGAVNAKTSDVPAAERVHHKNLLVEIERAEADGRLSAEDAVAARTELARDVMRAREKENNAPPRRFSPALAGAVVLGMAVLSVGVYSLIGQPTLPGAPLSARAVPSTIPPEVAAAIEKVEAQMARTPEDVAGWRVLAPVYMRAGRYADAANAFRRVLTLAQETPDADTDLAEALSMANGGVPDAEAMSLLEKAAAADPRHVRSRFYLAGEAMRQNDFERAERLWAEVVALSDGTESWLPAADQALKMAEAALSTANDPEAQDQMISGMVEGLAARLDSDGGTVAEWTQLVRAFIVLGQTDRAQKAYDDAKTAYPDARVRADLDALAKQNGLE